MDSLVTSNVRCSTKESAAEPYRASFSGDREASRNFGSSFGRILKFAFQLKIILWHIFRPKAKQSFRRKEAPRGKSPARGVRGLNGHRREALGAGRLSHRLEGSAKRHTTLWNPDGSASIKDSQAIKGAHRRIA